MRVALFRDEDQVNTRVSGLLFEELAGGFRGLGIDLVTW